MPETEAPKVATPETFWSRALFWLAYVTLAAGLSISYLAVTQIVDHMELDRVGSGTTATITETRDRQIKYAFRVPGGTQIYSSKWTTAGSDSVSSTCLDVRYLARKPSVHRPRGRPAGYLDLLAGFFILGVLPSALLIGHGLSRTRREMYAGAIRVLGLCLLVGGGIGAAIAFVLPPGPPTHVADVGGACTSLATGPVESSQPAAPPSRGDWLTPLAVAGTLQGLVHGLTGAIICGLFAGRAGFFGGFGIGFLIGVVRVVGEFAQMVSR